jgi:uncharacterized protein with FMN-binding domain
MTISMILAWLTVICAVLAAFKYIARISKNRALNQFFHKIHIPFGALMLVFGLLHGLLAGNPSFATLSSFTLAPELFTLNWGTACLVLGILLALTYLFRRRLKKKWMPAHRALTVALIVCLALHLLNVGIQLPGRLFGSSETASVSQSADAAAGAAASAATDTTTDTTTNTATDTTTNTTTNTTTDTTNDTAASSEAAASDAGTASSSSSLVTFSGAQLKDGTYEGSADGYEGTITVSVTVSGGQVTDITVVSESDSPQFFNQAKTLLDTIISGQTLEVDAVSGATFSSAGLINATADALQQAVVSGTLQVNSIDLTSVNRRGH